MSLNVYKAKTHTKNNKKKTSVLEKDFDFGWIALDTLMISVLSGVSDVKWRKHFPLLKFLHLAFLCMSVMKRVDHGSEAH